MVDILQDFPIRVPPQRVYEAISQPARLDQWWTLRSRGKPEVGSEYTLDFGPEYVWRARVTVAIPGVAFEWQMTQADRDWADSRVRFEFVPSEIGTTVRFQHRGWPEINEHYRVTCHCWALYFRILRRHLELGEVVPYERRLDA